MKYGLILGHIVGIRWTGLTKLIAQKLLTICIIVQVRYFCTFSVLYFISAPANQITNLYRFGEPDTCMFFIDQVAPTYSNNLLLMLLNLVSSIHIYLSPIISTHSRTDLFFVKLHECLSIKASKTFEPEQAQVLFAFRIIEFNFYSE